MKKTNRILAILLAVMLLAGVMATGAMALDALEDTGTVTIENALAGVTYEFYRVFNINAIKEGANEVTYITNSTWHRVIYDLHAGYGSVAEDKIGSVVTPNTGFNQPAQAQEFAAMAIENKGSIQADETVIVDKSGNKEVTGLQYGFYIMVSSRTTEGVAKKYTTFTLKEATLGIEEKNEKYPQITKTVNNETAVSVDFGTKLNYEIILKAAAGEDEYTLTDTMNKCIVYNEDSLTVTAAGVPLTAGKDYEATYTAGEDQHVLTIKLLPDTRNGLEDGTQVVVTYTATLSNNTVTEGGYPNTVALDYAHSDETPVSATATVRSALIRFVKRDLGNTPLAGAKFVIQNKTTKQYAKLDPVTEGTAYYFNSWVDDIGDATEIITGGTADTIIARGFAAGEYLLIETEAPANYIKGEDTDFIIKEDRNKATGELEDLTVPGVVTIRNTPGSTLPSTGGVGTTIFYIAGGLLVLCALALVIVKRKKAE